MDVDRFGNVHAPNLSYARGNILRGTEDDFQKLRVAWSLIRKRGVDGVYIFTGLEHGLPLAAEELQFADDELASALSFERLRELALDHLGGSRETDDVAVFNRLTGATMATHLTLVKPGDVVIGVSASHSHPSVVRAAGHVGARFIDSGGLGAFRDAIATERTVALVVLTRLAVTYDLLPLDVIETVVRLAHDRVHWSMSMTPVARGLVQPLSVSRGCWSSASISVRPGSTNTALRDHVSVCSPAREIWLAASG